MVKFKIKYEYTWEGTVEVEADSQKEAEELFYDTVAENELDDLCPDEYPAGGYNITEIKEDA